MFAPAVSAATTLAVSVTSADASIAFSLVWSASVKTLLSVAASTAARISASVWSAVADASIAFSLLWSASVKTLLSVAASTAVRISASVLGRGKPPTVEPSWITRVSLSVSTVTSRFAPVNEACSVVVPPRSCNFLLMVIDLQSLTED